MKKVLIILVIVGVAVAGWFIFGNKKVVAPNEIPKEEPKDEITYINASADLIQVELPYPGAVVGKEFSVLGKARGNWFFEASFPVELIVDDNVLANGVAQAQGEWMTTEFVPFKVELEVTDKDYIGPATLVLHKDNPSGLAENDASISFPVIVEY